MNIKFTVAFRTFDLGKILKTCFTMASNYGSCSTTWTLREFISIPLILQYLFDKHEILFNFGIMNCFHDILANIRKLIKLFIE